MQKDIHIADIAELLDSVMEKFQISECRLVGIVHLDNILEFLQFQEILQGRET